MNYEEYKKETEWINREDERKRTSITMDTLAEKGALAKVYALSNNKVCIGDIVSDEHNTILVTAITTYGAGTYGAPGCRYKGVIMKGWGERYKVGNENSICQSDMRSFVSKGDHRYSLARRCTRPSALPTCPYIEEG